MIGVKNRNCDLSPKSFKHVKVIISIRSLSLTILIILAVVVVVVLFFLEFSLSDKSSSTDADSKTRGGNHQCANMGSVPLQV